MFFFFLPHTLYVHIHQLSHANISVLMKPTLNRCLLVSSHGPVLCHYVTLCRLSRQDGMWLGNVLYGVLIIQNKLTLPHAGRSFISFSPAASVILLWSLRQKPISKLLDTWWDNPDRRQRNDRRPRESHHLSAPAKQASHLGVQKVNCFGLDCSENFWKLCIFKNDDRFLHVTSTYS